MILAAILAIFVGSSLDPPDLHGDAVLHELARAHAAELLDAARLYRLEHGRWPDLEQLTERDSRGVPYLATLPHDPWDHDYAIRELRGDRCQVRSCGPDGEPDTGDDIVAPPG